MAAQILPPDLRHLGSLTSLAATEGDVPPTVDPSEVNWKALARWARRHRVESLVARTLSRHELGAPDWAVAHFAARAQGHTMSALRATRALHQMTDALDRAGIPFLLMKGQAVAERYYQYPSDRQAIDIDILVRQKVVDAAADVLGELGFAAEDNISVPQEAHRLWMRLNADIPMIRAADGIKVELHWRLAKNPYLIPWTEEEMFGHASRQGVSGVTVEAFRPAPLLVYLLTHGARHHWFRLKWLADIDRMVTKISDEDLAHAASLGEEIGCTGLMANSLELAARLYGTVPDRTAFLREKAREKDLARMIDAIAEPQVVTSFGIADLPKLERHIRSDFSLKRDLAYKRAQFVGTLVDVRDVERFGLSGKWLWAYLAAAPFTKSARLIGRAFRLS